MSPNRGILIDGRRTLSSNRKRKRRRKRKNNNNTMNAARKPPFEHQKEKEEEDEDDNTKPSPEPPSPDQYQEDDGDDHEEVEDALVDYVIRLSQLTYRSDYKQKGVITSNPLKPIAESKPESTYELGESSTASVSCSVCKEAGPVGTEMKHLNRCGHWCCEGCIPDLVAGQINDLVDITKVKCAESNCKNIFSYEAFGSHVPEEVMERWKAAKNESSVLCEPMNLRCPFGEECGRLFVDDERGFQIRACPYCWRVFCVRCRVKWHLGKSCEEFQEERRLEEMALERKREEDAALFIQLIQRFHTVNAELELLQKQQELLNQVRNQNLRGMFPRRRSMWDKDWDEETQRVDRMEQLEQEKQKILKQLEDLGLPLRAVVTIGDRNEEE